MAAHNSAPAETVRAARAPVPLLITPVRVVKALRPRASRITCISFAGPSLPPYGTHTHTHFPREGTPKPQNGFNYILVRSLVRLLTPIFAGGPESARSADKDLNQTEATFFPISVFIWCTFWSGANDCFMVFFLRRLHLRILPPTLHTSRCVPVCVCILLVDVVFCATLYYPVTPPERHRKGRTRKTRARTRKNGTLRANDETPMAPNFIHPKPPTPVFFMCCKELRVFFLCNKK